MKLFLPTVITSMLITLTSIAQNDEIPIAVQHAFDKIQPETEVHWDLENELAEESESFDNVPKSKLRYSGQFRENGTISAHIFNGNGNYIRKEIGIKPSELPVLTQVFIRSEMQHPISRASRWETLNGTIEYCVTLGQRKFLFSQHGDKLGQLEL